MTSKSAVSAGKTPAKQLCVDVRTSDVTPPPPGTDPAVGSAQRYLCYKTKCPKQETTLPATDEFGSRVVVVKKLGLVCAPIATTTTTTTSTSTSSLPPALSRCCEILSGCFDGLEAFVTETCATLGTLGEPGEVCDGATGTCKPTGSPGQVCCTCPVGGFCFEGPIVPFGDLCFEYGCTPQLGVCDDVTHTCRTP